MKIISMVFLKEKKFFRANGSFWAQKWRVIITLDQLSQFFSNFAQWKGSRGTWRLYQQFFWKNYLWHNWTIFRSKMTCSNFKFSILMYNVQTLSHTQLSHSVSHNIVSNSCPMGWSIKYMRLKGGRGGPAKSILARMGEGKVSAVSLHTPQFFCRFITKSKIT